MSALVLRIRRQERGAIAREGRTASLYALARDLGSALDEEQAAASVVRHAADLFQCAATLLLPASEGSLSIVAQAGPARIEAQELGVARWAFEHEREAGIGTDTLPGSRVHCAPLRSGPRVLGVLVLAPPPESGWTLEERNTLDALTRQGALALERAQLVEESKAAALLARTEEMRSSLLSAVSHDLRTPLASITGAASVLRDASVADDPERRGELVDTIGEEAERLERLVANLLDMTRLEGGGVQIHPEWIPLEEGVGSAPRAARARSRRPNDRDASRPRRAASLRGPRALRAAALEPARERGEAHAARIAARDRVARARAAGSRSKCSTAGPAFRRARRRASSRSSGVAGAGQRVGRWARSRDLPRDRTRARRQHRRREPRGRRRMLPRDAAAPRRSAEGMSAQGPLVLLVEDDAAMRRFLRAALTARGFRLVEAETAAAAEIAATSQPPDLVLLDLGLPDADGIDVTRRLREWTQVPILVLSARGREADKVEALDAGADDYVTKPFGVDELLARMRVAFRHAARGAAGASDPVLELGALRIDVARHEAMVDGRALQLTPIEWKLLLLLARNAGKVLTHRQILREVWGPGEGHQTHTVRVHMASLRKKLELDPAQPRWLLTEPGVGYRLRDA